MTKAEWRSRIQKACAEAGTYKPFFETIIDELAQILEIRDSAMAQFIASGNSPVVMHKNRAGHENIVRNPALAVISEQNQQALAYWRDLGLTPKGYKTLTGEGIEEKKSGAFEAMLERLDI